MLQNDRPRYLYRFFNFVICLLAIAILGLIFYGTLGKVQVPAQAQQSSEAPSGNSAAEVVPAAESSEMTSTFSEATGTSSGVASVPEIAGTETKPVSVPLDFSAEQQALLQELFQALQEKDSTQAGMVLWNWYFLWREQEDWVDFTGCCYDGQSFSMDYTGTAMASDGITRFYYGTLENGVPNGQGVRIALIDGYKNVARYFWVEGNWTDGILTGEARMYFEELSPQPNGEYTTYREIQCTFDGTPEEVMVAADVFQQDMFEADEEDPMMVFQYAYHVANGQLVETEWSWESYSEEYQIVSRDLFGASVTNIIELPALGEERFQNPFPWGEPYRFAYQPMFNCGFFI